MFHLSFGLGYLLVYIAAGWALRGHPLALSIFGNVGVLLSAILVIAVVIRRRHQWAGCQRLFWDTFAVGMSVWAIGHLGWAYGELNEQHRSWLQWHTVFSLCGGLGPFVGLIARPHAGPRSEAAPAVAVDVVSYGLLIGFLYTYFVLVPAIIPGGNPEAALLSVVQMYRGLLMIGMGAAAIAGYRTDWFPAYAKLALAATAGFFLRLVTNQAIAAGTYHIGSLYDFAWITPFLGYAWAAHTVPPSPEIDKGATERRTTVGFAVFSATPVLLIPLIGYSALNVDSLGPSGTSFRALITGLATVAGLGLLTVRLVVERAELRRADARMRLLAAATEQTRDLILITRADGTFEHANEAFLSAVGYTRRDMMRQRFPQPIEPIFETVAGAIPAAVQSHGVWRGTLRRLRRDGTTFPSASTVVALKDASGAITHFVAVERDITDELKVRDQLVHSERLSAVGELVAGVAHEINNPLQTIVGCVELMLDERADPSALRHDLQLVRREAGRAGHIIRNLLAFVRRSAPDRVSADLNDIVAQTAELREYHLRQQNVHLNMRCTGEPLPVSVNREEIQQVILNLLLNAEQALESGEGRGAITIRTMRTGRHHVVEVSDNGPGVSAEIRGRIFEPFFTTKDVGAGTGLGLSISHGIVTAHGGTIELCESTSGACFRVTLPADLHAAAARLRPAQSANRIQARRALVIDDEEPIRRLLARLLARRGFEVTEAESCDVALPLIERTSPGIILCDVRMSGMTGLDLYHRIRREHPMLAPGFIFITGDTIAVDQVTGAFQDAAVLAKPFTAADLDDVLRRLDVELSSRDDWAVAFRDMDPA